MFFPDVIGTAVINTHTQETQLRMAVLAPSRDANGGDEDGKRPRHKGALRGHYSDKSCPFTDSEAEEDYDDFPSSEAYSDTLLVSETSDAYPDAYPDAELSEESEEPVFDSPTTSRTGPNSTYSCNSTGRKKHCSTCLFTKRAKAERGGKGLSRAQKRAMGWKLSGGGSNKRVELPRPRLCSNPLHMIDKLRGNKSSWIMAACSSLL
jgi:hypothetical protein